MNPLPALIDAIDKADIPIAVYRTAVRLALRTDETGRVVMGWDEYQALTGCEHPDAARRHLRALRTANLASWRGGTTVIVVWTVSRQYVPEIPNAQQMSENAQLVSENAQLVSENRQLLRVDNNKNGYHHKTKRQLVSENKPKLLARRRLHDVRPTVSVEKKTASVWNRAVSVEKRAASVCHLYAHARSVSLFDPIPMQVKKKIKLSTQLTPNRDEAAMAYELLVEVGVMPAIARELATVGFETVRRAVANWWADRREVGGKLDNKPGAVVYWLKNPSKAGLSPHLPAMWLQSEIGKKYITADERAENVNGYSVPGVYHLPPIPPSLPPKLPPAMPHDDPWQVCLKELSIELPAGYVPTLSGSRLEQSGMARREDGSEVPAYRVLIAADRGRDGLNHFTRQVGAAIRRKLGSVLGHAVVVEIVAAPIEQST